MKISLKNKKEIEYMRISGKITANVLEMIKHHIKPFISTDEINQICHDYITKKKKAIPACLGYHKFPKSICISVNDVVCHGIPNKNIFLMEGDIVNIDVAVIKNNYYSDASKMFYVGKINEQKKLLCNMAKNCLYESLKYVKPGVPISGIGKVIQNYIKKSNFSIVREYCGHGIGKNFHELPQVLHYENTENDIILKSGMTFTIEPMINEKSPDVYCSKDGWTIKTRDKGLSAQYEHTILITNNGCEILTIQNNENIPKIFINS
ncbi:methionine aminopeptidase [Buchnera aphidicola (Cinara tujafilina)]|uniref:Methionine aminopeptidase n=1 Tax=Buchnera aphidicola (Cinara tujafilina) TaxID=261317 RepID=F7WZ80_9GAMM|nr:type I methionyl aminopeptidase [Buchnera aphidicola]AEH39734.1 methionine aminopeptidase [Buchnera aphidicola (Cinara tujafilina)]